MLEARSVAMVGASPRFDTPGYYMVKQLVIGGFTGEVAAVNPRYDEVEGIACYPGLDELPFVPDLVLLAVGNRRLEGQMEEAARCGARGVVVFASGLEDPPDDPPLTERLRSIAAEAGMAVCGANCMGFADIERGLRALAFEERADLEPGNVAWMAHSGALAGDDAAYEALFDAYGVARVGSLNEMADLLELLGAERRAVPGGLAAILDSGGERAHLVDAAADLEVPLARPSEETLRDVAARLEPGLPAVNPLDAWGTDKAPYNIFVDCSRHLAEDPDTGAFAYVVDLHSDRAERGHAWAAQQIWASTEKPFAVVCGVTSAIQESAAARLRSFGIPVLEDVTSGLRAFQHLFERRDASTLPSPTPPDPVPRETVRRWREALAVGEGLGEARALEMIADYGVPVARTVGATDLEGMLAAAGRLGYPVALKTAAASHKTELGGVTLGLRDENALAAAYGEMSSRLGPSVTVQEMVGPGVEMALGVAHDPQFGPLVMVAAGGVLIETLGDRRLALPTLDEVRASKLIDRLDARPVLDGVRGV